MAIDLLENCSECYAVQLSEFPASVIIKGGLAANTNYILKVFDKFGNAYSAPASETDGTGNLTVTVPGSFPVGWFNRNAGSFKLEVSLLAQPWQPVEFTFNSVAYPCIDVEFVNDQSGVNTIES
jgi:hypothetical protein